jgi:hypothetical protein
VAIDFTRYQPPGVYTENVGGPQLAVRSSVPTAVAIFGLTRGYRTYRESLVIPPDVKNSSNEFVPAVSAQLTKKGIKVVDTPVAALSATNVDVTNPGASIGGVTLTSGNYVRLYGQTKNGVPDPAANGLYRWTGATATMTPVTDSFRVVNPDTGYVYVNGKDYTIHRIGVGDDTLPGTRDDSYTIKRVRGSGSALPEKTTVQIFYHYTDPNYYEVYSLYDYDDVRDFYGEPFDANGNVVSELTLAAKFAFLNGATNVLTCGVDQEAHVALSECYQDALDRLRDEEQIAVIVPATGDTYIHGLVQQHVNLQSNDKYERRAILGFDGSATTVATNTRITLAQTLSDRRIALISPSRFRYYAPELSRDVQKAEGIVLGGQFMAAAVAGRSVSQIAAMPLTRKAITGFLGPDEMQREGEKNLESQNGLMVVEKTRRNQIQVRHGVTTDPTDILSREWSIIGQQDVMVYRIRDFLDADGLIGMPIYDTTLIQVKASAEAALVSLIRDEIIVGYQNLKVRQIATLPDVIEVRYEWKPAYPLNYIVVRYSVAVMTGDVTVSEATL